MKNIAQLYCLSICFIATLITLIYSIYLILSLIDLSFFDIRHKDDLNKYNTNESYLHSNRRGDDKKNLENLSSDQLTAVRLTKKNNYIDYSVYIIISLIFLCFHYKLYKRNAYPKNL